MKNQETDGGVDYSKFKRLPVGQEFVITASIDGRSALPDGECEVPLLYGGRRIGTVIKTWTEHGRFALLRVPFTAAYRLDLFDIQAAILETSGSLAGDDTHRRRNFEKDEEKVMKHGGDNEDLGEADGWRQAWLFHVKQTGRLLTRGGELAKKLSSVTDQEGAIS